MFVDVFQIRLNPMMPMLSKTSQLPDLKEKSFLVPAFSLPTKQACATAVLVSQRAQPMRQQEAL